MSDARDPRYDRQRRLPEIGEQGQARIRALRAEVRGEDGAWVEAAYLRGAGVAELTFARGEAPAPIVHAGIYRFGAARAIAAGAWRALGELRTAVEAPRP